MINSYKNASFCIGAVNLKQIPEDLDTHIVFFGKSNVGKSTFINTILNRKKLAYSSKNPGKTQELNFYKINNLFYCVDVPGYGYANMPKNKYLIFNNLINDYLKKFNNKIKAFVMVDIRRMFSKEDLLMLNTLKYYNVKHSIIFTKVDKLSSNCLLNKKKILKQYNINYILSSSKKKIGIKEFWDIVGDDFGFHF